MRRRKTHAVSHKAMERISVDSLDEVLKVAESKSGNVYILFCGSVLQDTGESWCSDCVKAVPVVEKVVSDQKSGVFIHCTVGERDVWKDPNNAFRKHSKLLLKGVPTLLQWKSAKRLGEEDCADEKLVKMLFEDDQ